MLAGRETKLERFGSLDKRGSSTLQTERRMNTSHRNGSLLRDKIQRACTRYARSTGLLHVGRLRTFRSLHNLEFDRLSFLQGAVTIPDDGRVMNKNIRAVLPANETVAFRVIEPFYSSLHFACPPCPEPQNRAQGMRSASQVVAELNCRAVYQNAKVSQ